MLGPYKDICMNGFNPNDIFQYTNRNSFKADKILKDKKAREASK